MHPVDILLEASERIYSRVHTMAGTCSAGGDHGMGAGGDISKGIDIAAEGAVLEYLHDIEFGCTVLGEECGQVDICGGGPYIVMDAVDGTTNAVRGFPFHCSSLAYSEGDRLMDITTGVVKNLYSGRTYHATVGGGAFADGRRIHAGRGEDGFTIIGLNLSGAKPPVVYDVIQLLETSHVRHMGANALELAILSEGLMDAFVDVRAKIRIQDMAAGYILVRESGGVILDTAAEPLDADLGYDTRLSFIAAADTGMANMIASKVCGALGGI